MPYSDLVRDKRIGFALDASAVLAFLNREPGCEWVASVLDVSILSAVNWAEVLSKSLEHGADLRDASQLIEALGVMILPFSDADAEVVAELRLQTKSRGLSLGDRACLALAKRYEAAALTADRAWAELDLGIDVQLIRGEAPS